MQELNKVKGYRAMLGLTQEEMANKLGLSRASYTNKETNKNFTQSEKLALESIFKSLGINDADANEF